MILPSGSLVWHKRSDGDGSGELSTQDQIIIGVVVGGVAVIAITAGIVFVIWKKRRWDRIQRHEEQLLAYHLPPTYKVNTHPSRPQSYYNPVRETDRPPTYHQTLSSSLPVYDPSKYQDLRPTSIQVQPVYSPNNGRRSSHLPPPPENRPFSFIHSSPEYTRDSALLSARGPSPEDDLRPSMHLDSNISYPTGQLSVESPSIPLVEGMRPPRRPKPVLSRLITNFG
ncbi:hypothetical protein ASPWEDRAFT_23122 [Aspergillus wentii DTO 134E9]|uniref:Uncharacterized protein n=1 Tax=Aspergillus wentii DTO 134E9 TaxID=1073089 RepID=A0A1L9S1F8_ASPWE|nr:uncharacterized protein ASPWEDRAFT_23122 [Aspergillus wentii DTO 134E9]KAI9931009.1 hypothetical protein MW887_010664 [Aspergillus wentii]OJJ40997.1 hypothetical protein ASPWEDRAFT_23122 [Aspergillus wentii DTO 134E9]